ERGGGEGEELHYLEQLSIMYSPQPTYIWLGALKEHILFLDCFKVKADSTTESVIFLVFRVRHTKIILKWWDQWYRLISTTTNLCTLLKTITCECSLGVPFGFLIASAPKSCHLPRTNIMSFMVNHF
ncbi:hypothetical protein ACJX0J_034516, partial [Zea mays]